MPRWRRAWHRSWRAKVRRAWGLRESRCRLKPSLATPSMERGMRLTAPRNRPAAAKISRKTGQGKGIGQAAPKIIKPEGDLVPVWGLQQALAASAGEVEAAQDQAAILAEQGERAHPEGEKAVAGEQAAD